MGNIDSRSQFDGGYLYVKTAQPYYQPGDTVEGTIYIRVNPGCNVQAKELYFRVYGYEYISYWYTQGSGKKAKRKRFVSHNDLVDFDQKCCNLDGNMTEGDYTFPFQFVMYPECPSSIISQRYDHPDHPVAIVRYELEARIKTSKDDAAYAQFLIIQEPPVEFKKDATAITTTGFGTCCPGECCMCTGCDCCPCCTKGTTDLQVQFEKNVFFPNEKASAIVTVDNSKSQAKVKEIEFEIVQVMKLNRGHFQANFEVLENQDREGIAAFTQGAMKKMELNLDQISYKVRPYMVKSEGIFSTTWHELTPDEEFFMAGMPPACHSEYITNEYHLNVNVKYSGCNCDSKTPSQQIPLTILPRVNPDTYGFEAPDGYAPTQLGFLNIALPPIIERQPLTLMSALFSEGGQKESEVSKDAQGIAKPQKKRGQF